MDINWENIDNLEDYFITYLLYKESKTVSQISKIRNISSTEASEQLIQAKLKIKEMQKDDFEASKDILDKFLELDKIKRLDFMDSLDDEKMVYFKRKVFKRILVEKNAEDENSLKILQQLKDKNKNFEKEYVLRAYDEAIKSLENAKNLKK